MKTFHADLRSIIVRSRPLRFIYQITESRRQTMMFNSQLSFPFLYFAVFRQSYLLLYDHEIRQNRHQTQITRKGFATSQHIIPKSFFFLILSSFVIEISSDFDMEFSRALGRGSSIVEMRQELRAFTVAFWMMVAGTELDPGTPISYAVQDGGISP